MQPQISWWIRVTQLMILSCLLDLDLMIFLDPHPLLTDVRNLNTYFHSFSCIKNLSYMYWHDKYYLKFYPNTKKDWFFVILLINLSTTISFFLNHVLYVPKSFLNFLLYFVMKDGTKTFQVFLCKNKSPKR